MLRRLRQHLTYANVMATLAVFITLGGSSYAALKISGSQIADRSVSGKKLKRNTLGGATIKESRLGKVPRARNADRLNGVPAARLLVRCPSGTRPLANACIETAVRGMAWYAKAVSDCALVDNRQTPGRRLPTQAELLVARGSGIALSPGGELTSQLYPAGSGETEEETLSVLYVTQQGRVGVVPNRPDSLKAFRCVADPLN